MDFNFSHSLRRIGFLIVLLAALLCLFHAISIITWLYSLFSKGTLIHDVISACCVLFLSLGFLLVTAGSGSKKNLEKAIDDKDQDASKPLVSEEYRLSTGDDGKKRLAMVLAMFGSGAALAAFLLVIFPERLFLTGSLTVILMFFLTSLIGVLIARSAGFVNVDVYEVSAGGYHIHETVLGLLFLFVGLVFILLGTELDLYLGLVLFFAGAFFIGRDWKDYAEGRIITLD
ncbi:hypothetical protein GF325_06210 [Candidatus Bathyarchaeota archaeon]|nr:hypothetical protein [Candidatus Bathyarchaeota archaeon]